VGPEPAPLVINEAGNRGLTEGQRQWMESLHPLVTSRHHPEFTSRRRQEPVSGGELDRGRFFRRYLVLRPAVYTTGPIGAGGTNQDYVSPVDSPPPKTSYWSLLDTNQG
jgi:hypothetical protein